MLADRVELSWDVAKSQWLIRITEGEEVIRRHLDLPKTADDQALRAAALDTLRDEGYDFDASNFTIQRESQSAFCSPRLSLYLYRLEFRFGDTQDRPRLFLSANHMQIRTRSLTLQLKHSRQAEDLSRRRDNATWASGICNCGRQACQFANRLRRNIEGGNR